MVLKFLWVMVFTLLASHAIAANDPDAIRARGRLIVSVKNQGANALSAHKDPAHFEKRGMEIELAHAIAARVLGDAQKVEFKMMRKPQRLPAIAEGTVDVGISMLRVSAESVQKVDFSTPYFSSGLAVLQTAKGTIQSMGDLAGKTLAVIERNDGDAAATLAAVAEGSGPNPVVLKVANFRDAVRALTEHKADALLSEAVNIDVFLARHGQGLKRSPLLTEDRYAVAVAKGNAALLAEVNAVLAELKRSGELAAMAQRAQLPSAGPGPTPKSTKAAGKE
jgi:ABC-type amino acid transport substrate-binding protein